MTDETLLTVPEVAERLRCTRKTVHNLILNGRLPGALRLDRVFRVPTSALAALEVVPMGDPRNAAQRRLAVTKALQALELVPGAPAPAGKPKRKARTKRPKVKARRRARTAR